MEENFTSPKKLAQCLPKVFVWDAQINVYKVLVPLGETWTRRSLCRTICHRRRRARRVQLAGVLIERLTVVPPAGVEPIRVVLKPGPDLSSVNAESRLHSPDTNVWLDEEQFKQLIAVVFVFTTAKSALPQAKSGKRAVCVV